MNTWLGSAFEDACLACVQDMHACGSFVVQHCADHQAQHTLCCRCGSIVVQQGADPISTTHTVLPKGGGAGWREERP